jgi:rubrerythrin
MPIYSRRDFLYLSATLAFISQIPAFATERKGKRHDAAHPVTIKVLQKAFTSEMIAHKHYIEYTQKALIEKYPNIAYLFHTFALSEKIHADNYKLILSSLGSDISDKDFKLTVQNTKSNLKNAAKKEMDKINSVYLNFIKELEAEKYEAAIISCMYAWKSHQQHEKQISKILKYSGLFFGLVAKEIEDKNPDFYVCTICGSTIDEKPLVPCDICNRSASNYQEVLRPSLR